MKRALPLLIGLLAVALVGSCGNKTDKPNEPAEAKPAPTRMQVADDFIALMDQIPPTLEAAKDADSAKKSASELQGMMDRMVKLVERMKELGPPEGEEKDAVFARMQGWQREADGPMEAALRGAQQQSEVWAHIKPVFDSMREPPAHLEGVVQSYGMK